MTLATPHFDAMNLSQRDRTRAAEIARHSHAFATNLAMALVTAGLVDDEEKLLDAVFVLLVESREATAGIAAAGRN